MRIDHILLLAALAASSTANAEIEKFVAPKAEQGISFHWWPKLPPIAGWHQDREQSLLYSINALAPEGQTFKNAHVVMYAKAIYKPMMPDIKSVDGLIENDKKDFVANVPGVVIKEVPALTTADGNKLKSILYFSKEKTLWERVSYGEEGDFFILFTISSSSLGAFNSNTSTYEKLVTSYKE